MQFVAKGPDIPDALLQAHEEGKVVFFCGAGISYPAGLPGFKGLVDQIYELLGTSRYPVEEETYANNQFDATLDQLERRFPGGRLAVRVALEKTLKPKLRRKGATDSHEALLKLARNRDGVMRMVTTNFDRVFEHAARRTKQKLDIFSAPMLPIPKNSRWDGLVYLHGQLPKKSDNTALQRLVMTSGDFGLAYLIERWAARFVSEMFRNYTVCFVGYSLNDPVLRYMMDALAADQMLGEVTPEAFAFADYESGQEQTKTIEWEAKGVTPILYEVPTGSYDHSALHSTLKVWAETYRDGVLGKERVVLDLALARPSTSTKQDNFVGRMLWALSDPSGLPAKRFAQFNPVPSLSWLECLSDKRYKHDDLHIFGVAPASIADDELRFSILQRPVPYTQSPWMSLLSSSGDQSLWDKVMVQLARWLVRHLNDPELVIWLAQHGGELHKRLCFFVENQLDLLSRLELDGNDSELDLIRTNAPNAIPSDEMQTFWRLLLTNRVKSARIESGIHCWSSQLERDGLTTTLRFQLRKLLAPKVVFKKPFNWEDPNGESPESEYPKQLIDCEVVLVSNNIFSVFGEPNDEPWHKDISVLFGDFQQLLLDALDLLRELDKADDINDYSFWKLPSINPHAQNRNYRDWLVLIELLRRSWLATRESDPKRAALAAQRWFDFPYPTFKRLAFYAASQDGCITTKQWVDWLLADKAWWLWSSESKRETIRLLVLQGAKLSNALGKRLETAILKGPPRSMYKDDLEVGRWEAIVNKSIWLLLAKLKNGGRVLGEGAHERFTDLSTAYPGWEVAENESDEFSAWMSGTWDANYQSSREVDAAPNTREDLVKWLKESTVSSSFYYEDNWREICSTDLSLTFNALKDLAEEGIWPVRYWKEALLVWSEEGKESQSWLCVAPLLERMSDNFLVESMQSITWWLQAVSKSSQQHESEFLNICQRILGLAHAENMETDRLLTQAINHPIGHITQALLHLWFKSSPSDDDFLPDNLEPIFTTLCDSNIDKFRYGRVLFASRLVTLFRVDQEWVEVNLLPFFDWDTYPLEASAIWSGFLWSPRVNQGLLISFKSQFLGTANHYADLAENSRQYAAFLTYVALDPVESYTADEFQAAFEALPQDGLNEVAMTLSQALDGAGEHREEYWRNRIRPFWQDVWPQSNDLISKRIAESLAKMCLGAGDEFPGALSTIRDWLVPIESPGYIIGVLRNSGFSERFPEDALILLSAINSEEFYFNRELSQCLMKIVETQPDLEMDDRYLKLIEYLRRFE